MTIDFHTHIFPDGLAERAMRSLTESIGGLYRPVHDGTLGGMLARMDEWGIGLSVVQPVVTKASQVRKTNEWAASVCSGRIACFGGIYPHAADYKDAIDFVAGLGLRGIKFHAEYQDFILDEPKMLRVYDYALSKGLVLLHHAGFDPAFPPPFRSSPERFVNVLEAMGGGVIVAAHLGGHAQWDGVEERLAGRDIYLDTSMGLEYVPEEQFMRIVRKHGADKILFASDSPWSGADTEIERLKKLPLTEREKAAILGGNAQRLLPGLFPRSSRKNPVSSADDSSASMPPRTGGL